ncbi:GNAT family N-acetyltransferase [Streptomyces griseoluteus]|uniref:GNAT family N-acetyltransferase n=1 Tax=Streptomyces griseoluteus TaxID=29306 RepID=UPI0036A94121
MTHSTDVPSMVTRLVPRPGAADDAAEITRLRSQLVLSEPLDEEWLAICRDQLASRLQPGGDARACVVDAPGGGLAACALALIHPVLSAPKYPEGLAARIQVVATEPSHRRRGLAQAAVSALLKALEREGVTLYELHASAEAAPLYEEFGFARDPALLRMTKLPQARDGARDDRDEARSGGVRGGCRRPGPAY